MIQIQCTRCGLLALKQKGSINRSLRIGAPVYCSRTCAGLARRTQKPPLAVRKAAKAAYDRARRHRLGSRLKEEKADYFQRTYYTAKGQRKARAVRRKNMARHVAYCRTYMADPEKQVSREPALSPMLRVRGSPPLATRVLRRRRQRGSAALHLQALRSHGAHVRELLRRCCLGRRLRPLRRMHCRHRRWRRERLSTGVAFMTTEKTLHVYENETDSAVEEYAT